MEIKEYTKTGRISKNKFPDGEMRLISKTLNHNGSGFSRITVEISDKLVIFTRDEIAKLSTWVQL